MMAGLTRINATRTHGAVSFTLGLACNGKKKICVEDAFVQSRATKDMSVNPVDSISERKHLADLDLADLDLADSDYGTPARVDIYLGADYYGKVLLHGSQWGLQGTPYIQRTCLQLLMNRKIWHIVAWILQFMSNCKRLKRQVPATTNYFLFVSELVVAE